MDLSLYKTFKILNIEKPCKAENKGKDIYKKGTEIIFYEQETGRIKGLKEIICNP